MEHWELLFFFFVISFVYASVGFGGGSSYLAVLAVYALPFKEIRLIALLCNIIVVSSGTLIFAFRNYVDWKKILPLVLASVPMAFLGAKIKMGEDSFFMILGISLILAAILLWVRTKPVDQESIMANNRSGYARNVVLGGAIGFLSGMVGIGGGIFLSPLLNLMKWDTPRKIAATASVFILVNSIAGIAGQLSQLPENINGERILLLCVAVFIGGQIGSRMGAMKFNLLVIRRLTAALVFVAGVEVLTKHLSWFK
jgi:uncharacterized membrane protein YfcA